MAETKATNSQLAQADRPTYATDFILTDIDNVSFLGNAYIDNIATTLIAMGNEMWTNRKRIHVLESLLEQKGVTTNAMMETYVATDEQTAAWQKEREVVVDRLWAHWARAGEVYTFADDFVNK